MYITPVKKLNHFIPEIFLSDSIRTINFNDKSFQLNLDYLSDLFHSFYIEYLRLKEVKSHSVVTKNLSSEILQDKYGKKYPFYIDFLKDNGFISLGKDYIAGERCREYKLRLSCLKKHNIVPYNNRCWKLINYYNSLEDDENQIYGTNLRKWIKSNLKHISIDIEKSTEYIENEFPDKTSQKYRRHTHSIQNIKDGNIYVTFDQYGRVHTNFTVLKKKIRKDFLKIDGDPVYEVDISNSQALFFLLLLSENLDGSINKSELRRFKTYILNGVFYDDLGMLYGKIRDDMKEKFFPYLFGRINQVFQEFEETYPTIHQFIINYKTFLGDYKKLAHKLQRMEGQFIFNEVCKGLYKDRIEFFTVHDSICVSEQNKVILDDIFNRKLSELKQRIEDNISDYFKTA